MTVRILLGIIDAQWERMLLELADGDRDLEFVGRGEAGMDLLLQAGELKVDVVVLPQPACGKEPGICSHLVLEYPNLKVLLLSDDGGSSLWRIVCRKESWKGTSKDALRKLLKA